MAERSPQPSDEALVDLARAGDMAAFNQLVDRYERVVYAVCLRLLRDQEQAEDATQDTFLRAYTSLHQFQGGIFRAWLLRIATNRSYDLLRHRRRHPADSLDAQLVEEEPTWQVDQTPLSDPLDQATRRELGDRLEAALAELPEDQRLVVILHDIHGYPYDEIAAITGVSLGTVKSRLSRGRARLREILRHDVRSRELFGAVSRQLDSER